MNLSVVKAAASAISTAVLVVCAVTVTYFVLKSDPPLPPNSVTFEPQPNAASFAAVGFRMGPPTAKVVLVEFSDFQCPACKQYASTLRQARLRHPDDFAVVYRHLPIGSIHRQARSAAIASQCAGEQGRFEVMHDILFAKSDSLGLLAWEDLARNAAVPDIGRFTQCMTDDRSVAAVARDTAVAVQWGPARTPTSILNDVRFVGGVSPETLDSLITAALGKGGKK